MRRSNGPAIRIERTAVKPFHLGLVGFDHLQLVYQPETAGHSLQDDWFVIEGVRDLGPFGPTLGVQGADGRLTLARANAAAGQALVAKLGTPLSRGSRVVVYGHEARRLWPLLATWALQIDYLRLPYVALGLPGMQKPTCNSSSVIATLLHRLGIDVAATMPTGTRFVPGIGTRIAVPPSIARSLHSRRGWHGTARHAKHQTSEHERVWRRHGGFSHSDSDGGDADGLARCR